MLILTAMPRRDKIRRMGLGEQLVQAEISAYERGLREPPLYVLLQYAGSANILVEWLIDDDVNLPDDLLLNALREWVKPIRWVQRYVP